MESPHRPRPAGLYVPVLLVTLPAVGAGGGCVGGAAVIVCALIPPVMDHVALKESGR